MSETPLNEPSSATEEIPESAPEPSPQPTSHAKESAPAPGQSAFSRWAALAALVLAVIAIAGAAVGWFYPHKSASAPTYTDQQRKDAKKHVCETFRIIDHAAVRSSRIKNPDNGGPIGGLAVLTAKNFAYYSGGSFLRDRLNLEPATPSELAKPANELATDLQELGIGSLAGAKEFGQEELLHGVDDKIKAVGEICKQ
jgi:hypothetical protein